MKKTFNRAAGGKSAGNRINGGKKRKTERMEESKAVVVQLLGDNSAGKKLMEREILTIAAKHDVDVVIRRVVETTLVRNFSLMDYYMRGTK